MSGRVYRFQLRGAPIVACVGMWLLAACEPPISPPEPTPGREDPVEDQEGPELDTYPITAPQSLDSPILVEATAMDPSGIYTVVLHYKPQNTEWQWLRMEALSEPGGYYWTELTADHVNGAGSVSYYLEAADGTPYHNTTYSPSTGAENPYRFNVVY